jgi:putative salt-induced outer membrane protein YdiY
MEANNTKKVKNYLAEYKTLNISDELAKSIDFGFSATTGTTDTLNISGRFRTFFKLSGLNQKMFKILLDANVFLNKSDNIKNNEEYRVDLDLEQTFDEEWIGYGNLAWFRNIFKNYDAIYSSNIGIGYKVVSDATHSLTLKFGLGYNKEIYSNEEKNKTYLSFNQYIEYNNKLTPTSHLFAKIAFIENIENFSKDYEMFNVIGLSFTISDNLSFSIEEEIYLDSLNSEGKDVLDTKTIAKIGYRF